VRAVSEFVALRRNASVPGHPPILRTPELPFSVKSNAELPSPNRGDALKTSYGTFYTSHIPMFVAVDTCLAITDFTFDWSAVDVLADRNSLRQLMRWLNRSLDKTETRMDVELVGLHTLLLGRWKDRHFGGSGERNNFGRGFEKETTVPAPGCAGSVGYQRIVTYVSERPPYMNRRVANRLVEDGRLAHDGQFRSGRLHPTLHIFG
jgi:hypothetical protein